MASKGFVPHITLEHRDTHAQTNYVGMTAVEALSTHYAITHGAGVGPIPEPVYEQTSVHLKGDPWFIRLPHPPEIYSIWRHFKGPTIEVLDTALHTETKEPLVIYREHATGGIWARPLLMFIEHVDPDTPRFFPLTRMVGTPRR